MRRFVHGPHLFVHENEEGHPCVSIDDYEICDVIDDFLTEDCDLDDEFLFYRDYPTQGHQMIELVGETSYEAVVAYIATLDLVEIEEIYASQEQERQRTSGCSQSLTAP